MKKISFLLVLGFCLMIAASGAMTIAENSGRSASPSQSPSASPTPKFSPAKLDLQIGEKHVYEISWKNISAGLGTMHVASKETDEDGQHYVIKITAESSKLVSLIYKVEDLFVSKLDVKKGFSKVFERHMHEGKSFREETITYDYAEKVAKYVSQKDPKQKAKEYTKPLTGYVLDPLGAVFYLRSIDIKSGDTIRIPMHSSDEDWTLKLDCVGIVGLRVPGIGKFNAWKLKPEAKNDALFTTKGAMTVWLEKTTKVVLRAEVDIPIGSIVIRLIRAENSPLETVNREEKRRRWIRPGTKEIP
ncbi:MAG: hypothetical protein Kow00107_08960 [Planctomycetota bacterium]